MKDVIEYIAFFQLEKAGFPMPKSKKENTAAARRFFDFNFGSGKKKGKA